MVKRLLWTMKLKLKMKTEIQRKKLACRVNLHSNHDAVPIGGCADFTQIMLEWGSAFILLCRNYDTVILLQTINIEKECYKFCFSGCNIHFFYTIKFKQPSRYIRYLWTIIKIIWHVHCSIYFYYFLEQMKVICKFWSFHG